MLPPMRILILLAGWFGVLSAHAQAPMPFHVTALGGYSQAVGLKDTLNTALGGGFTLRADVFPGRRLGLALRVGMSQLTLEHPYGEQLQCRADITPCRRVLETPLTVQRWGWSHWNVYRNSGLVGLSAEYGARLIPVQTANVYSLSVMPSWRTSTERRFRASIEAGPVGAFSIRKMYLREEWDKNFASIDYVFDYQFRNNAPDKDGFGLGIEAGASARYAVFNRLDLVGGLHYRQFLAGDEDALPFRGQMMVEFGLSLR